MVVRAAGLPGAAAAAFAFAACLRKINDPDYWTHLALGRAYVEARSIFVPEPFLASGGPPPIPPGTGRVAHALFGASDWPFQIALHGLRAVGGDAAVSLVIALLAALAVAVLVRPLRGESRPERLAVAAIFLASVFFTTRFRFSPRPEVAGIVLLAGMLALAYSFTERPRGGVLIAMVALIFAWRSVHVSWSRGAAFAGVTIAARPRLDFWHRQTTPVRVAAAAVVAVAGFAAARFAAFVLGEMRGGGILVAVTEMRPTWEFPSVLGPFCAVAAAGFLLAWGERDGRWQRIAVWGTAALVGSLVVRNVALASLAMVPGALRGLRGRSWPPPFERRAGWATGGAALVMAFLLLVVARDRDYLFGLGVDWRHFPGDSAEFVRATPLARPVFSSWSWGGYLDWAWNGDPRTFLDGRLADRAALRDHDLLVSGAAGEVLARRGFGTVLLQPLFLNSGRLVPAVPWFLGHPSWRLVRATDGLVFTRLPLPDGVVEASPSDAWRAVLDAALLASDQNDDAPHAEFTRAVALLQLGRPEEGLAAWERGRRGSPEIASQYEPLGSVLRGRVSGGSRP